MKQGILFTLILIGSMITTPAYSGQLPNFDLKDPQGGNHSSSQLKSNGLIAIVSSPTLKDKGAQSGWARDLVATKGSNPATIILIENMTASAFEGMAESHMKKAWKPGTLPILLEDKSGKVSATFGVGKDETKVFAYDKTGNLVYSTASAPSVEAAKTVWSKLAR